LCLHIFSFLYILRTLGTSKLAFEVSTWNRHSVKSRFNCSACVRVHVARYDWVLYFFYMYVYMTEIDTWNRCCSASEFTELRQVEIHMVIIDHLGWNQTSSELVVGWT
jgi:hypothetical protein